jgi:hypothetical protein
MTVDLEANNSSHLPHTERVKDHKTIYPPIDQKTEVIAALLKGGISSTFPLAGGIFAEIGNLYLNPLEKRKQRWMIEVSTAIEEIRTRFSLMQQDLEENESFISFLLQVTDIALKNHQDMKINALRNALISSANPSNTKEDLSFQFLRYIDELSVTHLKILSYFASNIEDFVCMESLEEVYVKIKQNLMDIDRYEFRAFLQDLDSKFLLKIEDLNDLSEYATKRVYRVCMESQNRSLEVTDLGTEFLKFLNL